MKALLCAIWVWLGASAAHAATLEQIRVFVGDGHARVLLVTSVAPAQLEPRSSPALGSVPARGILLLNGTTLADTVPHEMALAEGGVRTVRLAEIGGGVQISVDLNGPHTVQARPLGASAVLFDLVAKGRGVDPALPSPEQLQAWVEGVSLVRAAGGPPRERTLVVVDAGHGGWDHGAVGTTGTREADIALQIALRTAMGLEARGVEVLLTRDDDTFLPLRERAALANRADADLFLSIHANAAPGPTAWGIETYSLDTASDAGAARVAARENTIQREQQRDDGGPDSLLAQLMVAGTNRLSRQLANQIQAEVTSNLSAAYGTSQIRDLGEKTALFYVLVSTRMPAVLFESGFVSNPNDERRLRTSQYQQLTADALVRAVGTWLEAQQ